MTTRRSAPRASRRASASLGAQYVVADERYAIVAIRRNKAVLQSTSRPNAYISEEVSGPLEPRRWTR